MRQPVQVITQSLCTQIHHVSKGLCNSRSRPLCRRHASSLHDIAHRSRDTNLVFQSNTNNPYQNLAIEHYLLTNTDPNSRVLLFYTNRPCVVIGRNQNPWVECDLKRIHDNGIDLVRRRSGGGTVFHDAGNLNFSIIVPNDKDFSRRRHAEMVVRALQTTPVQNRLFDHVWVNKRHDITMRNGIGEFKVSGSAFKLTRGRALHHGTLLHSSPNLGKISQFLRAPGKDYIQAKGVESVRSPVSNLFLADAHDELRTTITKAVVSEFEKLYGRIEQQEVGDADCQGDIVKGIDEIMSNDWKYSQTPRFEYNSMTVDGKNISMHVNHGMVEKASFNARPVLHEVKDWKTIIGNEPNELLDQLQLIFPTIPHVSGKVKEDEIIQRDNKIITRRLGDGTVEVEEHGQNTVKEAS